MSEPEDFNARVIAEFRQNAGQVGGFFEDKDLLLLHTRGARSGEPRLHPLVCMQTGAGLYVIASAAGSPVHPAWYHNLVADPGVEVEFGVERYRARAKIATEPERGKLYDAAAVRYDFFREYAEKTAGVRTIPVVVLERLA